MDRSRNSPTEPPVKNPWFYKDVAQSLVNTSQYVTVPQICSQHHIQANHCLSQTWLLHLNLLSSYGGTDLLTDVLSLEDPLCFLYLYLPSQVCCPVLKPHVHVEHSAPLVSVELVIQCSTLIWSFTSGLRGNSCLSDQHCGLAAIRQ